MSKQDLLRIQTCVLKVNIHCDGCALKVKKLLHKIDGVYSVRVDADEGKVVVAGDNVDPAKLVKKLKRGGKHAEIWGGQQGIQKNYPINPQFQNMQLLDQAKDRDQKGQLAHFPNIKAIQNLKVPAKEQKSVKFNLPEEEEFDASDEYDDDEEEEELGHVYPKKMMGDWGGPHGPPPVMMMNGPAINHNQFRKDNSGGSRNINGTVKKADVIDQAMLFKGKAGNFNEPKNDYNFNGDGKKGEKKKKKKKKNEKSDGGGVLSRFLGFGKKESKRVELEEATNGAENKKFKEGKLEGHGSKKGKDEIHFHDYDTPTHPKNGKSGKGGNNGKEDQMGPSPIKMKNIPAVQGFPAMNGHDGMQMQHVPYNNLHQEANMYPTSMMYGRPHPSMNYYMPPPPMPSHPMADPITHTFSDENVDSCTVM